MYLSVYPPAHALPCRDGRTRGKHLDLGGGEEGGKRGEGEEACLAG